MSDSFFSSTEFQKTEVLQSTLWVNPERVVNEAKLSATLSLDVHDMGVSVSCDGLMTKRIELTVSVNVRDDIGDDSSDRMRAQVVLAGGSRAPKREGIEDAALERYLGANSVSSLYATARTYLEFITSMSPIQRFTLPAIDPYKVIDSNEE